MPIRSITTTAQDVFFGSENLTSLTFVNGSTAGIIFLRYKPSTSAGVTSSDYEVSLTAGKSFSVTLANDGNGIVGPWSAISDTGGGVTLEILPIYLNAGKRV